MKIVLNKEYAIRHLFVVVLMVALGGWFMYDAFITYPSKPADVLYEEIEGAKAPESVELEKFKSQKIASQKGLMIAAFLVSFIVGLRLLKEYRFKLDYDGETFTYNGKTYKFSEITSIDDRAWENKSIFYITIGSRRLKLDGWHHSGVKEFYEKCRS
jgi:hypothetical protein